MDKQRFIIFSPIFVILIGSITIRLAERFLGVWAWVPWILVYWTSICFLVFWGSGKEGIKQWMGRPQGSWLWSGLAILLVLQSLAKLGHYSRNKHFVLFEPSIRYRSHIHRGTTSYLAYQCLGLGSGFWGDLQEDKQLTVADC